MPPVRVLPGSHGQGPASGAPDPRGPDLVQRPRHRGRQEDPLAGRRPGPLDIDQVPLRPAPLVRGRRPGGSILRSINPGERLVSEVAAATPLRSALMATAHRITHVVLSMEIGGLESIVLDL